MKLGMWIVLPAFALGFAIAWTAKPTGGVSAATGHAVSGDRTTARPSQTGNPHSNPAMERVKNYLRRIDESSTPGGQSANLIEDISTADIPLLIEQWRKRAGFSGLERDQQNQIKELVKKWYKQEPQAALDWVTSMECKNDRQALVAEIVEAEAEKNFDHAVELAKLYGKRELGGLNMPYAFWDKLGDCDAARLMEILSAFPPEGTGNRGSSVDFKPDFDFTNFAKIYDDAQKANQIKGYSFFPSNMVEEWTKRDPQAAWEWIAKERDRDLPFNSTGDFFSALAKTRTKEQINQFVIDQMATRSDEDSKIGLAWQALTSNPDATQVADFINRMPGNRDANLERLAMTFTRFYGTRADEFKDVLVSQMTAEERVRILPKVFADEHDSSDPSKLASTLKQLGHTDAEINAMLPKAMPMGEH